VSLNDAVYAALTRPEDLPRRLLVGGLAVTQVLERLPAELQRGLLGGQPNEVLARRQALEELTFALDDLVQEGRVRRKRARMKSALVDVYRRRWI
jgi:hypothetical protein